MAAFTVAADHRRRATGGPIFTPNAPRSLQVLDHRRRATPRGRRARPSRAPGPRAGRRGTSSPSAPGAAAPARRRPSASPRRRTTRGSRCPTRCFTAAHDGHCRKRRGRPRGDERQVLGAADRSDGERHGRRAPRRGARVGHEATRAHRLRTRDGRRPGVVPGTAADGARERRCAARRDGQSCCRTAWASISIGSSWRPGRRRSRARRSRSGRSPRGRSRSAR